MKIGRFSLLILTALLPLALAACGPEAKDDKGNVIGNQVDVDADQYVSYADGVNLQFDTNIYTIKGVIDGGESLTRQVSPASGSVIGTGGFVSGSYTGAVIDGKGIYRVLVKESDSELALVGSVTILKSVDTKAVVLQVGDEVTFKCRHQEEVVEPILQSQVVEDRDSISTWEIDGCKLVGPAILSTRQPAE